MQCPSCRQDNPPGSRFCSGCANRLELRCAACGNVNPVGSRFCNGCGQKLPELTASAPERSPDAYTPKHLAERIINSKAALEGERKQVTVLFADLKGSMELLAERDPEEARTILDPVLEHMMKAVHQYEGTVNHVMGDGIMALSGRRLPTKITRCARAMPCGCREPSGRTPGTCGALRASTSRSGSA